MRSMTGYGEAAAENARHGVAVSVRGVNHRFLDLQLRLAEEARAGEGPLRDLVGKEVSRGRVEMRVEVRRLGERRVDVDVNMAVSSTTGTESTPTLTIWRSSSRQS